MVCNALPFFRSTYRFGFIHVILAMTVALSIGCGTKDSIDEAVKVLDTGIADLKSESIAVQDVLLRLLNELPEEMSEVIRIDLEQAIHRSIAATGGEFRCNADFLRERTIQALYRTRSTLLGQTPPPLRPEFCHVIPSTIDLSADPDAWRVVTLHGFDLDATDKSGNPLAFHVVSESGESVEISESVIGRTTHYELSINVWEIRQMLHGRGATKIVTTWDGYPSALPEVVVSKWEPARREHIVDAGSTHHTPPYVQPPPKLVRRPKYIGSRLVGIEEVTINPRSDRDFSTDDDEHMSINCKTRIRLSGNGRSIETQVYLRAREERSDWTEVRGWSDWESVYVAPRGWRVAAYVPMLPSSQLASITTHGPQVYSRPGGEIARRLTVYGDRGGDEAGTWTRVEVDWRPLTVTIEELEPNWL